MKKLLLLMLCPLLLFSACSLLPEQESEDEPFSAEFTIRPPESLTEVFFDIPLSTAPNQSGSPLSTTLPGSDNVLQYADLRDLLTQSMFAGEPDACAALWTHPIRYTLEGSVTSEDRTTLSDMATDLIQITSFPGMRETDAQTANVIVRFADVSKSQFTFSLDADGAITQGQITIPASLPSRQRQAQLAEKMFRLFGFFHETDVDLDSILSETPANYMTEADLILLETVYSRMQPGMPKQTCLEQFEAYFTPAAQGKIK